MVKPCTLLNDLSFPHVAGNYALPVVELPCFTAPQINGSRIAERCPQTKHARACFDDIITAVTLAACRPLWLKRCHGLLHTRVRSPNAEVSAVISPCSVALQQQIIRDGFILITFSLIFFYRHAATPHWLWNIPQVGVSLSTGIYTKQEPGAHTFAQKSAFVQLIKKKLAWWTLLYNWKEMERNQMVFI